MSFMLIILEPCTAWNFHFSSPFFNVYF